jgi:hypothetical protein
MKDLISQIEQKFALLLAIAMFFPILMGTYFTYAGGTPAEQKDAFSLFPLVGLYILAYTLFAISKIFKPVPLALKALEWFLIAGIACFAVPTIVTIVAIQPLSFNDPISYHLGVWEYTGSLWGVAMVPWMVMFFSFALFIIEMLNTAFPKLNKITFCEPKEITPALSRGRESIIQDGKKLLQNHKRLVRKRKVESARVVGKVRRKAGE